MYHNSNFLITYDNNKTISTQTDLFNPNYTSSINNILTINHTNNSVKNLNFTYQNINISNNKINFRELYLPITKIKNNDIIPIYLDIFLSQYYTTKNLNSLSTFEKIDIVNKSRIKNKILHIFQNNNIIYNNQYTNITPTHFYKEILNYKNNVINPFFNYDNTNLSIPSTLFMKDDEKMLPNIKSNLILPSSISHEINLLPIISLPKTILPQSSSSISSLSKQSSSKQSSPSKQSSSKQSSSKSSSKQSSSKPSSSKSSSSKSSSSKQSSSKQSSSSKPSYLSRLLLKTT